MEWGFVASRRHEDSSLWERQEDSLHKMKVLEYTCGLSTAILGFSLYSYYVRELLAYLALFTSAFVLLGLVFVGVFLLGWAALQAIRWTGTASRDMVTFSRRLAAVYTKS
jgi:hypothetical protein